jgi:predicted small secreted protein
MKKTLNIFYLLVILALLLAACAPVATTGNGITSTSDAGSKAVSVTQSADTNINSSNNPGNPPSGNPPGNPSPSAGKGSSSIDDGLSTATGAYTLNGGSATLSDQVYTASNKDQSGVYVTDKGALTLNNITVTTSGNTSSDENSSFYGLNAGVLAASGSTITINSGTISTTGTGANGAFAAGDGSVVNLTNVTINASGDGGHGVMVTLGGKVNLTNVDMTTSDAHSAPIATDRGSGTITSTGGKLITTGADSPCYYSTGVLDITDSTCNATMSEVAVIEGANSVNLINSTAQTSAAGKWGVMIYQSFSGDAEGSKGNFTMNGGSLSITATDSPLFYVTNSIGNINLKNVKINAASGILLKAQGNDRWGTSGSNGGAAIVKADSQTLVGDFVADKISSISLDLTNGSSLTGAINADNAAKSASLTLDSSSAWTVAADSYITSLVNPDGISGTNVNNIIGNGHTVYYNADSCPELNGQTFTLVSGGILTPSK